MEFTEEVKQYIQDLSNLLNGQIRGSINKIALSENLELIQMTMGTIYENAFLKGYQLGVNMKAEDEIRNELIDDIKGILKEGSMGGLLDGKQ